MLKRSLVISGCVAGLLWAAPASAQNLETYTAVDQFVNDALWYADAYISPAADGAIYQASSGWIATPQKRKLWDVTVSVHNNVFFVPKSNRKFNISNDDFSFFRIEDGRQSATVPTALGNDEQLYLTGTINGNPVRVKTPEGIDSETVIYPYLQASLGLWAGTELVAKYSYNVKLKKGNYQVYGLGFNHNLSQYCKVLQAKNVDCSVFAGYSHEKISFGFLNTGTGQYGSLGLDEITGLVGTWQFQLNASKKWRKWEAMAAIIGNVSDVKYEVGGDSGTQVLMIPVRDYLNERLAAINTTKANMLGEISGRYRLGHFYTQAAFAFGKFANLNMSVQYEL